LTRYGIHAFIQNLSGKHFFFTICRIRTLQWMQLLMCCRVDCHDGNLLLRAVQKSYVRATHLVHGPVGRCALAAVAHIELQFSSDGYVWSDTYYFDINDLRSEFSPSLSPSLSLPVPPLSARARVPHSSVLRIQNPGATMRPISAPGMWWFLRPDGVPPTWGALPIALHNPWRSPHVPRGLH